MKPLDPRLVGVIGLSAVTLILGSVIATSGQEPGFDGDPAAVLAYFRAGSEGSGALARFGVVAGLMAFAWFAVGLAVLLGRAEGREPWRSAIGAASALIFVAGAMNGNWQAATHRADTLSAELAAYAFDVGNLQFANGWVALGSFALCTGWAIVGTRAFPRWLGWLAILAGAGLILSRAVWTSSLWLLPYLLFWVWMIALSVLCLRRGASRSGRPERAVQEPGTGRTAGR